IVGGVRADVLRAPLGTNIMLGDNGVVNLNNAGANDVYTTDPALGSDDQIYGGAGANIILGGSGNDLITGGDGRDIVFGDSGIVRRNGSHTVTSIASTDICIGGNDVITGGGGDNILIGGAGIDSINGGSGNEIMVGGAGTVDLTATPPLVTSGDDICDSGDVIHGRDGNDIIWGGGGLKIGKDVFLTDVGAVIGEIALNAAASEANVQALLNADLVLLAGRTSAEARALLIALLPDGNDTISGGDGNDSIFGQRGNDTLGGDAGDDFIAGGTGNDAISGDAGNDTLIGDDAMVDSAAATGPNVTLGLNIGGQNLVPQLQIVPGGTPNAMVSALPHVFGTGPAGSMLGDRQVFASIVTDFRHSGLVRGNDVITGGLGDDRLVGDDQIVLARSYAFDATTMAKAEALTRGLLDVADDYNDLIRRQYWLLDDHDFHDNDHDDTLVIDHTWTIGADTLYGDAVTAGASGGAEVLIGDDSVMVEPSFTVRVEHTDDFERFVEGVADAGDELADAIFDLEHLDYHLRDVVVSVRHNNHFHDHVEHHLDVVQMGNDSLFGSGGNDLIIGDRFELRTVAVTVVPGGLPNRYSDDDAWKDSDWNDCSTSDWFDH